jgi:hypothetical protein
MADNCNKKIRETLYTLLFADFFYKYSQRKTYEVPTRYRADTGEDPSGIVFDCPQFLPVL